MTAGGRQYYTLLAVSGKGAGCSASDFTTWWRFMIKRALGMPLACSSVAVVASQARSQDRARIGGTVMVGQGQLIGGRMSVLSVAGRCATAVAMRSSNVTGTT